jgi:hypothetical protein
MISDVPYDESLQILKAALGAAPSQPDFETIRGAQAEVQDRFGPIFSSAHVPTIREDEFRSFLDFKNNRHWSGLHRQGPRMCADMARLRDALQVLLDESRPVGERVDYAANRVPGMGKGIATAILHVGYPAKYGVWNNTSEAGLKQVGLWPRLDRGMSLGAKYVAVNDVLTRVASELQIDLWTLDALIWLPMPARDRPEPVAGPGGFSDKGEATPDDASPGEMPPGHRFALEAHLQSFLWLNWDQTSLGGEWARYVEPGDPDRGYEYPCGVGRIDILAKHRTQPRWLVVELKRGQSSDQTVGQILRYMGWIRHELASEGESVEGLIVAREPDTKIRYALEMLPNVGLQLYEVDFRLVDAGGVHQ